MNTQLKKILELKLYSAYLHRLHAYQRLSKSLPTYYEVKNEVTKVASNSAEQVGFSRIGSPFDQINLASKMIKEIDQKLAEVQTSLWRVNMFFTHLSSEE